MKVILFMLFIASFIITILICLLAYGFSSIVLLIIAIIFALITTILLKYTLERSDHNEK